MIRNHWMKFDDPIDGTDRVKATYRINYRPGPGDDYDREPKIVHGTLPIDAVEIFNESEHLHEDGSLALDHLDPDTREQLEEAFEATGPAPESFNTNNE